MDLEADEEDDLDALVVERNKRIREKKNKKVAADVSLLGTCWGRVCGDGCVGVCVCVCVGGGGAGR